MGCCHHYSISWSQSLLFQALSPIGLNDFQRETQGSIWGTQRYSQWPALTLLLWVSGLFLTEKLFLDTHGSVMKEEDKATSSLSSWCRITLLWYQCKSQGEKLRHVSKQQQRQVSQGWLVFLGIKQQPPSEYQRVDRSTLRWFCTWESSSQFTYPKNPHILVCCLTATAVTRSLLSWQQCYVLFCFPSRTSHILQSADKTTFKILMHHWKQEGCICTRENGANKQQPRLLFLPLLSENWKSAAIPQRAQAGIRKQWDLRSRSKSKKENKEPKTAQSHKGEWRAVC